MKTLEFGEYVDTANNTEPTKAVGLQKLDFVYNWNNKLDCHNYTTFRMFNPNKYRIGQKFGVYLKQRHIHDVQVIDVKTLLLIQSDTPVIWEGKQLAVVNDWIARLDTGYDLINFRKMVENMYSGKKLDYRTQKWNLVIVEKFK